MKLKERQQMGALLQATMIAVFEHGKAQQRLEDAIADDQIAREAVNAAVAPINELLNTPGKSELN